MSASDSPSGSPSDHATNLEQQRKLAKELLKAIRASDVDAIERFRATKLDANDPKLADAQLVIAREAGFDSWPKLVKELEKSELHAAMTAMHSNDAATLRRVLRISPSVRRLVNAPIGPFGGRPINMAAHSRELLDVLIDAGADINLRSEWKEGPFGVLDYAPEDVARHLVANRGAILTAHAAARLGWFDELRKIVEANPKVVHEKGGDGQRPLHFAKTPAIAEYLLDHGAEIDARCVDHHSTPAQYALAERPDVARFLLERGATPDIFMPARLGDVALATKLIEENPACVTARVNWSNYPPVPPFNTYCWSLGFYVSPHEVALKFGQQEVYDLLMRNSPPIVRVFDAAWRGDEPTARAAIADQPDVMRSFQPEHHSMLAQAVHHQRDAAVKLMLDLGFDPSGGGVDGGTALHQAAWVGRPDYIEMLLPKTAALINQRDPTHGGTPLGWAIHGSTNRCNERGDYPRAQELLKAAGAK
ncbi:MAG: ankyrin repeat domain-containing protein [Anaerolineae bacterium]|nr:ankyrin repeat domain-containing protein [Phycisphaerae bacterium]